MKPREQRRNVMIPARLRLDGHWADIRIRNLSSRGLRVETQAPLKRGSYVEIFRQHQIIVGRVVWSRGAQSGLRAQDLIDIAGLVDGRPARPPAGALPGPVERRRANRDSPAERAERSRRTSSMIQFLFLAIAAGGGAIVAGDSVRTALAGPLGIVSARL